MKLDEERLKILNVLLGKDKDYVEGKTNLTGIDLAPLMFRSAKSGFVGSFLTSTEPTINGLLFGGKVSRSIESHGLPTHEQIERERKSLIKSGYCGCDVYKYRPMNKDWVRQIIEMDEVMRASKACNTQPTTVYRGTTGVEDIKMNGLSSTSTDKSVAIRFYKGSMLKINLPEGFPTFSMHLLTKATNRTFESEKEIVLPPCEYEIVRTYTENYTYEDEDFGSVTREINIVEINVKPINLAKAVLNAMEHLPADYPKEYVEDPVFEFKESLQMLRDYITKEVEKGKITIGNSIIKEKEDPVITFDSELSEEFDNGTTI